MLNRKIKITTILGTRPELIRMVEILKNFDIHFDHRLLHSGQNSEKEMNEVFFNDFKLRDPDLSMNINADSLGSSLANLFVRVESDLMDNRPDALVVLGDTNTGLATVIAKRMMIPIFHIEGGNRSFDLNVPEEINRKIIDHTSDFNLVYSEQARRNLLHEGIQPRTICLIGSPLKEVISKNLQQIKESKILSSLLITQKNYILISYHRQENIDSLDRLKTFIDTIEMLADHYRIPIIVSTHPRLEDKIKNYKHELSELVILHKPFSFFDYCNLQMNSRFVISDSGSISEEAAILGFKGITLRNSIERPESIESGTITMVGPDSPFITSSLNFVENSNSAAQIPYEYSITDTSRRVVNFIFSTVNEHSFWFGIRK